jgi:hypothetical protein
MIRDRSAHRPTHRALHDALISRCQGVAPRYVHELAVLVGLDRRRPELCHGRIRRHLEPVVLRAIERLSLASAARFGDKFSGKSVEDRRIAALKAAMTRRFNQMVKERKKSCRG